MAVAVLGHPQGRGRLLPLDPEYPEARLGFMLADAGASVPLVHQPTQSTLREHSARVVCLDTEWDRIARGRAGRTTRTDEAVHLRPEHPAYAIYTSGSTGRPRGVCAAPDVVRNLIRWNVVHAGSRKAVLQFASLSFDAQCARDVRSMVARGRALVMVPESWQRDTGQLLAYLSGGAASMTVHTVPSWFCQLWGRALRDRVSDASELLH